MDRLKTLIVLLCAVVASSLDISTEGDCGLLDGQTKAALDKVLNNLPQEYVDSRYDGHNFLVPKLILGKSSLTGLHRLQVDRPYQVFCRGGDKVVHFSLRSPSELRFVVPWEFCSAHNGSVGSTAGVVQYEGEVQVQTNESPKPTLRLNRLTPKILERINLEVHRIDPTVDGVVVFLGQLFAGPMRLFWVDIVSDHVSEAIKAALSEERVSENVARLE